MTTEAWGWLVCGLAFVVCLSWGHVVQWFIDCMKREDAPVLRNSWNPATGGPCERCGFPYSVQYGVSVWYAETRRDGEVTYNVSRRLCTHCREQVEAEIETVVEERVQV